MLRSLSSYNSKVPYDYSVDFTDLLISHKSSILESLGVINKGKHKIGFVIDSENRLIGVLSDGDVRRCLINSADLSAPVSDAMQTHFAYIDDDIDHLRVKEQSYRLGITALPQLNPNGSIKGVWLRNKPLNADVLPNSVVILAGGLGSRLRPFTDKLPKPMLTIGGRPILEIILGQLADCGFRNFYFSVNYLKEVIIRHFDDGSFFDVDIQYLIEDERLGTAGPLSLLPPQEHPFLVLNGDVLTKLNFNSLLQNHLNNSSICTICTRDVSYKIPFGVVEKDHNNNFLGISEKPSHSYPISTGIYAFEPQILDFVPNTYFDMPDLLNLVCKSGNLVSTFSVNDYWLDIGVPDSLLKAQQEWSTIN